LDNGVNARVIFLANSQRYELEIDLRYRSAHASGGIIREPGSVGNLPSGEAYIVPYEGERADEPSQTRGSLPVQFDDEIVLYEIEGNRAINVISSGKNSDTERVRLLDEPAYGNIAELGIGVLGEWGISALGILLLDEKLGLHIAFGRSDHFGGVTSPASFRNPKNVVHIDRVYVRSCQPLIGVQELTLTYLDGGHEALLRNGSYLV
jgi:leucyl aminopeptidase (aminopeptidase T)